MSAGSAPAGRARVELTLDDKIQQGLRKAQRQLRDFGKSVGNIGRAFAGFGVAILTPMGLAAKQFSDVGDQLNKMSARTGVSVEALSALSFAAEQSGTNSETLEKSIRKMQKTISDAGSGMATATDALGALGLVLGDVAGLAPENQFRKIAKSLDGITDPTKQAAVAMDVFGKSGAMLIPMLGDMEALEKEAADLGLVMSTEDATSAAILNDAINRLSKSLRTISLAIGGAIAPELSKLADSFLITAQDIRKWIDANGETITVSLRAAAAIGGFGVAIIGVGKLINLGEKAIWGLQKAYSAYGAITEAVSKAPAVFGAAVEGAGSAIKGASSAITLFKDGLKSIARDGSFAVKTFIEMRRDGEKLGDTIKFLGINFKSFGGSFGIFKSLGLLLGQVAVAAGVAVAGFKLGEVIADWTGLTAKIKDAYFWLGNIKELNNDEVRSKQIDIWKKQLEGTDNAAEELEKRIKKLDAVAAKNKEEKKSIAGGAEAPEVNESLITASAEKTLKIRELEYELQYKGFDLAQKKLELEKEQAIAAAKGQATLIALTEKEFELKQKKLDAEKQASIEAKKQDEIKAISDERTASLQAEAARILDLSAAATTRDIDQEKTNEELMLDLQYQGYELEKQKLALAEKRALAEGEALGYNLDLVKQEFDLRNKILDARETADKAKEIAPETIKSAGTFSGRNLQQVFGGGSVMDRVAIASEATAKHTKQMVSQAKSMEFTN